MNRQQKEVVVSEIKQKLSDAQATFLVNYKGLDVALMQSLRNKLREQNGQLKVTKTTLMKIATDGIDGADDFSKDFKDQVGLVFANDDISGIAKSLVEFSKQNKALDVLSGFYESKRLEQSEVMTLATLPSREELLAKVVGTMQAPIGSFVRVLNMLIVRLVYVLKRIEEQKNSQ